MNSTKLFNFNFFIQNLKKSRAMIAILCTILPMFTILQIVNSNKSFYEYTSLVCFNIFFMYIIPVTLSITLFSYLYKKNSVDFIASKPISRKSMFFTNLIGGSVLLILIQLVTFVLQLVLLKIADTIYFPAMLWDIFLYQTIGYLFVYAVSMLAMSVSGNTMTQIAITMLITFFVPLSWMLVIDNADTCIEIYDYIYTAPMQIVKEYQFEYASIIKMLILIVLYVTISYIMFKRKKFEVAGESFLSEKAHLIVKAFTLLPFTVPFIEDIGDLEENCIILGISLVYWFVYDLITSKKIKFFKNIVCFIISFGIILGTLFAASAIVEKAFPYVDINNEVFIKNNYKVSATTKLFINSKIESDAKKAELLDELKNISYDSANQTSYYYGFGYCTLRNILAYDYQNHTLVRFEWDISKNYDLINKLAIIYNDAFKRNLNEIDRNVGLRMSIENNMNYAKSSYNYDYIYNPKALNEIYEFIEKNIDDEVDVKKEYVILQLNDDYEMKFISNKVDEVKEILDKYKDEEEIKYNYDEFNDYYEDIDAEDTTTEVLLTY